MKKILQGTKALAIVLLLMLTATMVNAANRFAVASGNWNSILTWAATSGGAPGASVPIAGDVVTIEGGFTVTITANAACATLNVNTGSLVVGGFDLVVTGTTTINGTVTVNNVTGAKTFDNLVINTGGVFNSTVDEAFSLTGSLTVNGTGSLTSGLGAWTFSGTSTLGGTGSATISNADFTTDYTNSGTYTFADVDMAGGGTVTLTNNGTINVTNSITGEEFSQGATGILNFSGASIAVTSFLATTAGNVVNYNGAAQTIFTTTYSNLTLSGTDVKTIGADITVNGNVTINSGATLTAPAGGSDDITIGGNWVNNGTFTAGDDLVTFNGATQSIGGTSSTAFNNLTISSSTATTLGINTSVVGNLSVTSGDFFNLGTFSCNRTAAGGTLTIAGTMRLSADAGGQTGSNYPLNFATNTLTGGTVEYNGSNAITQTLYATPTYENIILTNGTGSGVADKIMTGSITMNGTLTVNANTVLTPGATNNFLAGATNTITGTGTIKVTRIAATPDYVSQYDFDTDDLDQLTVDYSGAGNQTINGFTYGSLLTSGSGTKTMGAASTVNDNITIGTGTVLNEGAFTLSLSSATININGTLDFNDATGTFTTTVGTNVLTMGATGIIRTLDPNGLGPAANASFIQNGGTTFTTSSIATNGTVEYYRNATSGQTVTDRDYNNLIINGNTQVKTWTLGAARTVNGSITISADAPFTIVNTQTINLKGDWEKNSTGAFVSGTSTINFNGSVLQTIKGTQTTAFNSVTINNTGAGVTLTTDATVNGVLTLTDGIVNTAATPNGLLLIGATGTAPGGGSTGSHINGPIRKTGASAFTFPVGKGGIYSPVTITAPGEAGDIFQAEYKRESGSALGSITASGLFQISNCEYWDLNEIADPGSNNSLSVTVNWYSNSGCGPTTYITDYTKLTLAHFNGTNWDSHGGTPAGSNTTGNIVRTGVTVFSPFALGTTDVTQNPLPVNFSDVKAFEKGTGVQIEWTNLTEKDLVNYIVERSANGRDFTAIAQVAPRSNQADKESYTSFDASPMSGANFYRIKVLEIDGKVIYSKLLRVDIGRITKGISIYPNPVAGKEVTVGFSAIKGQYTLRIINAAGQEVFTQRLSHPGGNISQAVILPSTVRSGIYNMMITGDNYKETKMFVVQ